MRLTLTKTIGKRVRAPYVTAIIKITDSWVEFQQLPFAGISITSPDLVDDFSLNAQRIEAGLLWVAAQLPTISDNWMALCDVEITIEILDLHSSEDGPSVVASMERADYRRIAELVPVFATSIAKALRLK